MRLSAAIVTLALVWAPALAHAQKAAPKQEKSTPVIQLTKVRIDKVFSLLQREAAGDPATQWDWGSMRLMSKREYSDVKNALMVAKYDAADATRLDALKDDPKAKSLREANLALFQENSSRLLTVLAQIEALQKQ